MDIRNKAGHFPLNEFNFEYSITRPNFTYTEENRRVNVTYGFELRGTAQADSYSLTLLALCRFNSWCKTSSPIFH